MEKLETAQRALATLAAILDEPETEIVRDATIQRFEYTFEACWKALKRYLEDEEGLVWNSTKSCFRAAFDVALISEEQTAQALAMTDERNMTSHTYIEAVARRVHGKVPEFAGLMNSVLSSMRSKLEERTG